MSVKIMSLVFDCNMPELKTDKGATVSDSSCKFVLLALADHASEDGEGCYPGVKKICRKTNLSTQTVVNALNALRHNGFTRLEGQSRRHTFNYTILVARIAGFQWLEQADSSGQNASVLAIRTNPSLPSFKPSTPPAPSVKSPKKKDAVDWLLDFQRPTETLIHAFSTSFTMINVNWETKTARQWLEWARGANVTPEQIKSAAEAWRTDKKFNWSQPTLQKIFENWPALMGGVEEELDPLYRVQWQHEVEEQPMKIGQEYYLMGENNTAELKVYGGENA